jgi:hypothetical protein
MIRRPWPRPAPNRVSVRARAFPPAKAKGRSIAASPEAEAISAAEAILAWATVTEKTEVVARAFPPAKAKGRSIAAS